MSDSRTGPRSAGAGSLSDRKRVERFAPDSLFGSGMTQQDDGRWTVATAGMLRINADDQVEIDMDALKALIREIRDE